MRYRIPLPTSLPDLITQDSESGSPLMFLVVRISPIFKDVQFQFGVSMDRNSFFMTPAAAVLPVQQLLLLLVSFSLLLANTHLYL